MSDVRMTDTHSPITLGEITSLLDNYEATLRHGWLSLSIFSPKKKLAEVALARQLIHNYDLDEATQKALLLAWMDARNHWWADRFSEEAIQLKSAITRAYPDGYMNSAQNSAETHETSTMSQLKHWIRQWRSPFGKTGFVKKFVECLTKLNFFSSQDDSVEDEEAGERQVNKHDQLNIAVGEVARWANNHDLHETHESLLACRSDFDDEDTEEESLGSSDSEDEKSEEEEQGAQVLSQELIHTFERLTRKTENYLSSRHYRQLIPLTEALQEEQKSIQAAMRQVSRVLAPLRFCLPKDINVTDIDEAWGNEYTLQKWREKEAVYTSKNDATTKVYPKERATLELLYLLLSRTYNDLAAIGEMTQEVIALNSEYCPQNMRVMLNAFRDHNHELCSFLYFSLCNGRPSTRWIHKRRVIGFNLQAVLDDIEKEEQDISNLEGQLHALEHTYQTLSVTHDEENEASSSSNFFTRLWRRMPDKEEVYTAIGDKKQALFHAKYRHTLHILERNGWFLYPDYFDVMQETFEGDIQVSEAIMHAFLEYDDHFNPQADFIPHINHYPIYTRRSVSSIFNSLLFLKMIVYLEPGLQLLEEADRLYKGLGDMEQARLKEWLLTTSNHTLLQMLVRTLDIHWEYPMYRLEQQSTQSQQPLPQGEKSMTTWVYDWHRMFSHLPLERLVNTLHSMEHASHTKAMILGLYFGFDPFRYLQQFVGEETLSPQGYYFSVKATVLRIMLSFIQSQMPWLESGKHYPTEGFVSTLLLIASFLLFNDPRQTQRDRHPRFTQVEDDIMYWEVEENLGNLHGSSQDYLKQAASTCVNGLMSLYAGVHLPEEDIHPSNFETYEAGVMRENGEIVRAIHPKMQVIYELQCNMAALIKMQQPLVDQIEENCDNAWRHTRQGLRYTVNAAKHDGESDENLASAEELLAKTRDKASALRQARWGRRLNTLFNNMSATFGFSEEKTSSKTSPMQDDRKTHPTEEQKGDYTYSS
ncbi:MAG: hypothetical protein ACE365_00435 [Gammaproteobacteria bacterium]